MPLLGAAAMLLSFDVAPEAIEEHDHWHTHEHFPERLAIPGFLRGTRWIALQGQPRYLVLYEVAQLATLTSDAYLSRLNSPSAWTTKMMPHYRGMSRGFCTVTGSFGFGGGHVAALTRFKPAPDALASLRDWLQQEAMPPLTDKPGMGGVHLLEGALTPAMTQEQRLRGQDAGQDWALLLRAYSREALDHVVQTDLGITHLSSRGATGVVEATYRIDYMLSHDEIDT
jgi:hypothetical protein